MSQRDIWDNKKNNVQRLNYPLNVNIMSTNCEKYRKVVHIKIIYIKCQTIYPQLKHVINFNKNDTYDIKRF